MIYIFVEGDTDETFISSVFGNIIKHIYGDYKIIQYSEYKKEKTKRYIKSINSMKAKYLFVHDQDGNDNIVADIMAKYPVLDKENIFISVYEIESWIIAGISDKLAREYKIKPPTNTDLITKEKFCNIKPVRLSIKEFIFDILNEYDVAKAAERSNSFNMFYDFFNKKKQAKDCF